MAKFQNDAMLDAGLAYLTSNGTEIYLCTSQPATRAAAIAASVIPVAVPSFTGPADGAVDGRRVTIDALNGLTANAAGDATHVALCSGADLLYVTTCPTQAVTNGGTVNIAAWDVTLRDVTP